ncbi:MAG: hypothetical protein AAB362_03345 [Patescibacteria group bacterium]
MSFVVSLEKRSAIAVAIQEALATPLCERPCTIFVSSFEDKRWAEAILKSLGARFWRGPEYIFFAMHPNMPAGSFLQKT